MQFKRNLITFLHQLPICNSSCNAWKVKNAAYYLCSTANIPRVRKLTSNSNSTVEDNKKLKYFQFGLECCPQVRLPLFLGCPTKCDVLPSSTILIFGLAYWPPGSIIMQHEMTTNLQGAGISVRPFKVSRT